MRQVFTDCQQQLSQDALQMCSLRDEHACFADPASLKKTLWFLYGFTGDVSKQAKHRANKTMHCNAMGAPFLLLR